ncbi:MAG: hypothetical protein LBV32_02330 [Tannerellaceae bacterium]|jgi:hypothetical protein|nr:hypothetical protein [Tannerellaceae bacterium]
MKKISMLICAGVLMSALCAAVTACNEPKEPEQDKEKTEIRPVPINEVSKEVSDFFSAVDLIKIAPSIFKDVGFIYATDDCVMINSIDELPKVDNEGSQLEYPAIDFDSNTLIIGHYAASHGGCNLVDQSVFVESKKIIMYISVDESNSGITIFPPKIFYGLYPKLPKLPINIIRK